MKTILCYGDSNTWGYDPANAGGGAAHVRFGPHERWAGVLRDHLGEGYWVVEEGLNGRTTVWPDPVEGVYKNGMATLMAVLESHHPLDLVIIMLGSNDLKMRYSVPARDIAYGAGMLIDVALRSRLGPNNGVPQVLLICPPTISTLSERFTDMFAGSVEKSRQLGKWYRQVAREYGCHFLDAGEIVVSSSIDGLHLDKGEHLKLGQAVAAQVHQILGG